MLCGKWGKSAAGIFRCYAIGERCTEPSLSCPEKDQRDAKVKNENVRV